VYAFLKSKAPGDPTWNFQKKYLVDKSGAVAETSTGSPAACEAAIKKLLAA